MEVRPIGAIVVLVLLIRLDMLNDKIDDILYGKEDKQ